MGATGFNSLSFFGGATLVSFNSTATALTVLGGAQAYIAMFGGMFVNVSTQISWNTSSLPVGNVGLQLPVPYDVTYAGDIYPGIVGYNTGLSISTTGLLPVYGIPYYASGGSSVINGNNSFLLVTYDSSGNQHLITSQNISGSGTISFTVFYRFVH